MENPEVNGKLKNIFGEEERVLLVYELWLEIVMELF
jgi:hypothetical protein